MSSSNGGRAVVDGSLVAGTSSWSSIWFIDSFAAVAAEKIALAAVVALVSAAVVALVRIQAQENWMATATVVCDAFACFSSHQHLVALICFIESLYCTYPCIHASIRPCMQQNCTYIAKYIIGYYSRSGFIKFLAMHLI